MYSGTQYREAGNGSAKAIPNGMELNYLAAGQNLLVDGAGGYASPAGSIIRTPSITQFAVTIDPDNQNQVDVGVNRAETDPAYPYKADQILFSSGTIVEKNTTETIAITADSWLYYAIDLTAETATLTVSTNASLPTPAADNFNYPIARVVWDSDNSIVKGITQLHYGPITVPIGVSSYTYTEGPGIDITAKKITSLLTSSDSSITVSLGADGVAHDIAIPTGYSTIADGTADGQTLRWEASNSAWEPSDQVLINDDGSVDIVKDASANAEFFQDAGSGVYRQAIIYGNSGQSASLGLYASGAFQIKGPSTFNFVNSAGTSYFKVTPTTATSFMSVNGSAISFTTAKVNSSLDFAMYGNGTGNGSFSIYDGPSGSTDRLWLYAAGGYGYISTNGATAGELRIQYFADDDVSLFGGAAATETPYFSIGGRNGTDSAARHLRFRIDPTNDDEAEIYNVTTLNIIPQLKINDAYTIPTSDGSANQVIKTNGSGTGAWADAGSLVYSNPGASVDTIGSAAEGSEAAETSTWTAGGSNGLELYDFTRVAYYDAGNETLYGYVRKLTFNKYGVLYSVGAETRVTIDVPVV